MLEYKDVASDAHEHQASFLKIWRRLCGDELITMQSDNEIPVSQIVTALEYVYDEPFQTEGSFNKVFIFRRRLHSVAKNTFPSRIALRVSLDSVEDDVELQVQRVRMIRASEEGISPKIYYHGLHEGAEVAILEAYDSALEHVLENDETTFIESHRARLEALRKGSTFHAPPRVVNCMKLADQAYERLSGLSKLFPGFLHACFDLAPRNFVVNDFDTPDFKLAQIDTDGVFCTGKIEKSKAQFFLPKSEHDIFEKHILPTLKMCLEREELTFVEPDTSTDEESLTNGLVSLMMAVACCLWLPSILIPLDSPRFEAVNVFYEWARKNCSFVMKSIRHAWMLFITFDLAKTDCDMKTKRRFLTDNDDPARKAALEFIESNESSCGKKISPLIKRMFSFCDPVSVTPLNSKVSFRPMISIKQKRPHITFLSIFELLFSPSLVLVSLQEAGEKISTSSLSSTSSTSSSGSVDSISSTSTSE